jgi:hypothetical protein
MKKATNPSTAEVEMYLLNFGLEVKIAICVIPGTACELSFLGAFAENAADSFSVMLIVSLFLALESSLFECYGFRYAVLVLFFGAVFCLRLRWRQN